MYRKNNLIELILILVIIGFGSGIIGSLIGVGGGIIMSPVLTYMGFSPAVIASSSLIAVFATSISSTLTYIRKKYINYRLGVLLALPAIPGSIIGGFFSNFISLEYFKIYFAVLLTSVGLYIIYKLKMLNASPTAQFTLLISTITGLLTHILLEHPDYSYGIALAFGAFFGAQLGSRSIHLINENILSKLLSFSLITVAINLIIDYIKNFK